MSDGITALRDVLDALRADGAGGYAATIPDDWRQGRTGYGGLTAALCARAARLAVPDAGPLRSLQISFIGPAAGPLRFTPTVLRRGRSVAFVGVDCVSEQGMAARATVVCGAPRDGTLAHERRCAPPVPGPEACAETVLDPSFAPVFLAHMELRAAAGRTPMTGSEPELAMWVRHRDAAGIEPESGLLAVGDTLPPAALSALPPGALRPASSVTWTVELTGTPPPATGWYLLHVTSEQAAAGYSLQAMGCFAPDGRLLAASRQLVAIF